VKGEGGDEGSEHINLKVKGQVQLASPRALPRCRPQRAPKSAPVGAPLAACRAPPSGKRCDRSVRRLP